MKMTMSRLRITTALALNRNMTSLTMAVLHLPNMIIRMWRSAMMRTATTEIIFSSSWMVLIWAISRWKRYSMPLLQRKRHHGSATELCVWQRAVLRIPPTVFLFFLRTQATFPKKTAIPDIRFTSKMLTLKSWYKKIRHSPYRAVPIAWY